MKKINATRDEIVKMLESGEIVFAADSEDHFLLGQGIILYDDKPAYAFRYRKRESNLIAYGRSSTAWYVDYAKPFEFETGDEAEYGGVMGTVEIAGVGSHMSAVWTSSCGKHVEWFSRAGYQYEWHTKPLLNFIRRPKKKVKKTVEVVTWVEVDSEGSIVRAHHAMPTVMSNQNKLLKSIATTEIEVEEE